MAEERLQYALTDLYSADLGRVIKEGESLAGVQNFGAAMLKPVNSSYDGALFKTFLQGDEYNQTYNTTQSNWYKAEFPNGAPPPGATPLPAGMTATGEGVTTPQSILAGEAQRKYTPMNGSYSLSTMNSNPSVTPFNTGAGETKPYNTSGLGGTGEGGMGAPTALGAEQQKGQTLSDELQKLQSSLLGKSEFENQQANAEGVQQKTQAISDLTIQLESLKREAAGIYPALEEGAVGKGITTELLGRKEKALLNQNAVASLMLASQLDAARGSLAAAEAKVQKAVQVKYGPTLEKIAVLTANLQLILDSPKYSQEIKDRAQAQLNAQNAQKEAVSQAKADQSTIWGVSTSAASNLGNFTPTPQYKTAAQAIDAIGKARTPQEALNIAVSTGLATSSDSDPTSVEEYKFALKGGYTGSYSDYQNEDANRKAQIAKAGVANANGLSNTLTTRVLSVAGQFDGEAKVKSFATIAEGNAFLQSISSTTTNPADNQAILYSFAKIMDPESVVREGEYATVQKYAQSWSESFGFNAARIINNQEFLTQQAIDNIKKTIQGRYSAAETSYRNLYSEYGRRINLLTGQTNGTEYITDYSRPYSSGSSSGSSSSSSGSSTVDLSGLDFKF